MDSLSWKSILNPSCISTSNVSNPCKSLQEKTKKLNFFDHILDDEEETNQIKEGKTYSRYEISCSHEWPFSQLTTL